MDRKNFNAHIIRRCVELLRSASDVEVYEGIILAAYLIEQAFKTSLRSVNPLLYFETTNASPERIARLISGSLVGEELLKFKTISAQKLVELMCELKRELQKNRENFVELFHVRNAIIHATDDVPAPDTSAETAVSALTAARDYIVNCANLTGGAFNPLTSSQFQLLQRTQREMRVSRIMDKLHNHEMIHDQLNPEEIRRRISDNKPQEDSMSWVETTTECPACGENAFDEIASVDVDVSDGMTTMNSGSSWLCRVCELELTPYELNVINSGDA